MRARVKKFLAGGPTKDKGQGLQTQNLDIWYHPKDGTTCNNENRERV